jgi:hypothetical protein
MIKHIKKKYLFVEKETNLNLPEKKVFKRNERDILKKNKRDSAFVHMTDGMLVKSLIYNYKGKFNVVPIPDFSLVYFDHAYHMNKVRKNKEADLFRKLNNDNEIGEDVSNELFYYFGHASSCIISLFTAMESFINHLIPDDEPYIKKSTTKTESYTKDQIQKYIDFNTKLKEVIPYYFHKNFHKNVNPTTQMLDNLKNLRDDLIHTKSEIRFEVQEKLLKRVLNFNYDNAFTAVQKVMNYYKPNYVLKCNCSLDY